jgi:hypothetical protein
MPVPVYYAETFINGALDAQPRVLRSLYATEREISRPLLKMP